MPPVRYLRDSRATVTHPINLASSEKGLQLLSSFRYYFSLSYLVRPYVGAEVVRFESFVFSESLSTLKEKQKDTLRVVVYSEP